MNYYSHHIGDFDRATRHLTRIERSIYRDLLDVYYDTEQPLTLDQAALCRKVLARTSEEVTAVEQVLKEFFLQTPRGWYHDRCEEELDTFRTSTSQKSAAGKASAAKRAAMREQALNGNPTTVEPPLNVSGTASQLTNTQDPIPTIHHPKEVNNTAGAKPLVRSKPTAWIDDFEAIWPLYPKKPGMSRADALKAFSARVNEGASIHAMQDGVRAYASYVLAANTEPKYIKAPETFFGPGKHWESDWSPPSRGSGRTANAQQTINNLQAYLDQHEN